MNHVLCVLTIFFCVVPALAQKPDLTTLHGHLTNDCKAIRGHAGRIVAETGLTDLNRDVAIAHAHKVAEFLVSMEQRIHDTRELLRPEQLRLVSSHYAELEKICKSLQDLTASLDKELAKANPDRRKVRSLAQSLRQEMGTGSDHHAAMKRKLGIRD